MRFSHNRRLTICLISTLLLLSFSGCRYKERRDLERNRYFAEIAGRTDSLRIGDDRFFEKNLLGNPHPEVRRWCALGLGRIGDPEALPLLYRALRLGDPELRALAAFAIGEIEDRGRLAERAIPPDPRATAELTRSLGDRSTAVQMRAIEALGKTGTHAEAEQIVRRLHPFVSNQLPVEGAYLQLAITALVRLNDRAAAPTIEKLAGASDPEIRWRALDALTRLETPSAVCIENLRRPDPRVRASAARALGAIGHPENARLLLPLLSPEAPLAVRIGALEALGKLKNPAAIPWIRSALQAAPIQANRPDQQNFAIAAARTLGEIGSKEAEETLTMLLDGFRPAAHEALVALARIERNNPQQFFLVARKQRFMDQAGTAAWIEAMSQLGGPEAAVELKEMLAQTLGSASGRQSRTVALLLGSLSRIDRVGAQELASALLESHDPEILRAAAEAYEPGTGSPTPWAPVAQAFRNAGASGPSLAQSAILSRLSPWVNEAPVARLLRESLNQNGAGVRMVSAALLRRAGALQTVDTSGTPSESTTEALWQVLAANRRNTTIVWVETTRGNMELELFREDAPTTTAEFLMMVRSESYDGLELDRVAPSSLVSGKALRSQSAADRLDGNEVNARQFVRGSVGMTPPTIASPESRLFIALSPQPFMDGESICFGRVIKGMKTADSFVPGDRIKRIRVIKDKITARRVRP